MTDCGVSQVGKYLVTECLVPCIKPHFDYWYCFDDNVQGLRDEMGSLEREQRNMDQKIEEARLRAESPTADVEKWSKGGDQKRAEAARILQGCDDLKAWNIVSRYSWGKRAQKMAEAIQKLLKEVDSVRISNPAPPPAMALISREPATTFESRRRVEEDIMKFLKDDRVCMIAICGGGGIGKTTMVERIEDRVTKENLFDEVVHVVVSQQIRKSEIQKKIAELLGLKFSDDTLEARAHKLHTRLQDSKRKLIVFDDVWEYFELKDIGIPFGNGFTRCKIILTSRVTHACKNMGARVIQMDLLTEEEAWNLFKAKVGSCVEDPDILPIAKDVAAECKGLPIALVTVGKALQDQGILVWKDSLSQLRTSMPTDFPDVIEHVYTPLKLSYDFLKNKSVKSFLLLCCMFPEDYDIPIEHLTFYGIGLDIFERITNIDEGRNRTHNFVEQLKSRFLLLDGDERHSVKMHDVVRDVAIFIGSKEMNGFLKCLEVSSMDFSSKDLSSNCTWMSIDFRIDIYKLFVGSNFPNLRLLMIHASYSRDGNIICFEGMKSLNVLYISDKDLYPLLPTLKLLEKLITLRLNDCRVRDISVLGELASLEILCIHRCFGIEVLPADIGRLNSLKLLELIECPYLKNIRVGVISSLVGLEELKIVNSFNKWEAKGNQSGERNASLSELESLRSLTTLEIDISDYNLFAEQICLSKQLVRYGINYVTEYSSHGREYDRSISLCLPGEVTLGNWILHLVRTTQSLKSEGHGSNNLILAEIESLRNLAIWDCSTMKKLVDGMDCKLPVLVHLELIRLTELEEIVDGTIPEGSNSFQRLESLDVQELPKLAHLWKSQNQNVRLGNLKSICIKRCPNLHYLFSVATARSVVQLQSLEIRECGRMEQLFWNEMESNTDASIMVFPKLEELILYSLPNLVAFSQGIEIIESRHQLTKVEFRNCPKLRTKIGKCPNLRTLHISRCESIEEILMWDEIKDEGERHIIFSELERLKLKNLPLLTTFCRGTVEGIKFPKLEQLILIDLPDLVAFSQGVEIIESLHQLIGVEISNCPKLRTKIGKCPNLRSICFNKFHAPNHLLLCSHIQSLEIFDCESIEEILMWDEIKDEGERHIMEFPELEDLKLGDLPRLTAFCGGTVEGIKFPNLEEMWVGNLPRLKSLLPLDLAATRDNHSLHFFCNPKVETPGLREIRFYNLQDTINKIWCRHVPINFFPNLVSLHIFDVNGINNLISFSIAENLVNLKYVTIDGCQKMIHVIEDEEEVSSTPMFLNLKRIDIRRSHKLISFCQSKHALELPSLEEVRILNCPRMETFTLGSLSTPDLSYFKIDDEPVETKDLNGGIRDRFRIKNENKEEHEHSFEHKKEEEEIEEEEKIE